MTQVILRLYEVLKAHPLLRWTSLVAVTVVLVLLMTGQQYKEDISDFLPLSDDQQQAFENYQKSNSARRIYVIFQTDSPQISNLKSQISNLKSQISNHSLEVFTEVLERMDTAQAIDFKTSDDPELVEEAMRTLYMRIPYLLTSEDYNRIDSLTEGKYPEHTERFIAEQLENDKQRLLLPSAGMMALQIGYDPLNLFAPVLERMKPAADDSQKMLLIDSPYGASETEHNARLVGMLQQVCDSVSSQCAGVNIHLTGGPVIAVGNAQQIKTDSMLAVTLAAVLIFILLWIPFRNMRNLLLIALSIGWGWLFAMGCLTLVHHDVSIIVIGISSVILGIAVNYPLHLIAHLSHTVNVRTALKEIAMPLVVGNITTVGAFLTLVPLQSVALRDLGLFSAFLLIGTILFVLLWLPHIVHQNPTESRNVFERIGNIKLENKRWVVWPVVAVTVMLSVLSLVNPESVEGKNFGLQTTFDADLRNINYMTDEQRQDMRYLEQVSGQKTETPDLDQWNEWRNGKGAELCRQLKAASSQAGFAEDSFDGFYRLMEDSPSGSSLTTAIVNNLSDNFSYIGWACGFIVFFFLWFSLGSIELALLSFLPMAVSWVWILGLMALLDIHFNVVNIILATFIFGQGDDYTIFMTEGCQYEYAYRRKMLSSYKYSIIISALIMFIGIGALIVAKHPALFSLAEVTIIGMSSVVLMAYLFPPLIFNWLVSDKKGYRRRPVTLASLLGLRRSDDPVSLVRDVYRYRGIEISAAVNKSLKDYRPSSVSCHSKDYRPSSVSCHSKDYRPSSVSCHSKDYRPSSVSCHSKDYRPSSVSCHSMATNAANSPTVQPSESPSPSIILQNTGWGEHALLMALENPNMSIIAIEPDEDRRIVAQYAAEPVAPNLKYISNLKTT